MTHFRRYGGILLVLVLCCCGPLRAEVAVPALEARVTDLTATLSATQKEALEGRLRSLEASSGAQAAILLVPTTAPETIEQFSLRVAEQWKLGHKGRDDGLLLLVAKKDRTMRLEVGYGLEGDIPDAIARRIIDETLAPRFRQGDFAGGLEAAVQRIEGLIGKGPAGDAANPLSAPAGEPDSNPAASPSEVPTWALLGIVAIGTVLRWLIGPLLGGLVTGGLVGAGAWFVFGALGIALFAGLAAFVFVLVGFSNWLSIGLSGVSRGGGGGGFSGGGGGFGGGGASGRW